MASKALINVYIGTYSDKGQRGGIYFSQFDCENGNLSLPELACEAVNPSYITVHPSNKFLYAVEESAPGKINAFEVCANKKLKLISQCDSGGDWPCYVSVEKQGEALFVANYKSGTIASIPIMPDGKVKGPSSLIYHKGSSINKKRQSTPHPHYINFNNAGSFVYVADLGMDKVMIYRYNPANCRLSNTSASFSVVPGAGPRHLAFHPNGQYVYLVNELNNTLVVLASAQHNGALNEVQTVKTLPEDFSGTSSAAEISVSGNGKFLLCSNRGYDSIALFSISPESGRLSLKSHQRINVGEPRHFAISPSGAFCLVGNMALDTIDVFSINSDCGKVMPLNRYVSIKRPACISFMQASGG